MSDQARRTAAFRRNPDLEALLREINGLLGPAQREIVNTCGQPAKLALIHI